MIIQLKSFTNDAASRTKGLQLKTKLEHAIKEERNISVDFDGIDKFASPFFNNSFSALGIQYRYWYATYRLPALPCTGQLPDLALAGEWQIHLVRPYKSQALSRLAVEP